MWLQLDSKGARPVRPTALSPTSIHLQSRHFQHSDEARVFAGAAADVLFFFRDPQAANMSGAPGGKAALTYSCCRLLSTWCTSTWSGMPILARIAAAASPHRTSLRTSSCPGAPQKAILFCNGLRKNTKNNLGSNTEYRMVQRVPQQQLTSRLLPPVAP